jgi:hypothetical protein
MKRDVAKVVSAEWLKVKKRKMTVSVPILVVSVSIVVFFGIELAARRDWVGVPTGFYIAAMSIGWMTNITVLAAVIISCFNISREFAFGTVKSAWVRPVSRSGWYVGKIFTAGATIGSLFMLAVAVVVALSAMRFGFTDLLEKDYLVHSARDLGVRLTVTAVLALWLLMVTTVVSSMIAAFFNHPGGAVAAGVGLGLLLAILGFFRPLRPFLLSTHISMPAEQMVAMSKGLPLPYSWSELLRMALGGAGAWMVSAFVIGMRVIVRKEITF